MSYRVKTVCAMTGIPRPTLLAWERRYDILEPRRGPTGHRIYVEEDVALLRELKRRVDGGLSIGEAVRLVREHAPIAEAAAPPRLVDELLRALLDLDRATADRLAASQPQPFRVRLDEVYLPLLAEVGERWARGEATVAQEHFVSGWVREQMSALLHGLGGGPVGGPTAICALAPGELHELALLAVAIHLALDGWRVAWLGADLPIDELCRLVTDEQPALVCLSVVAGHDPDRVLGWARRLREAAAPVTTVAVGGPCARGLQLPGVEFLADGGALRRRLGRGAAR